MTLGSLFDGAGGFPFAAQICGIKALWASEIEPFPIAVTKKRFPDMKHLGDITKINGAEIKPVDIITFGSPCQDLSVAGNQKGLSGEHSGLFMEAVRIIKEMREKTNDEYPRFAVWENVPGAFSSNKGEDFRTVLEELVKAKDGSASIPRPSKGKWSDAGEIMGDGYSVAWRVLDAQFWGVPQRRRRIFLVADFRGECAGKILFERPGLSRDFAARREAWKGITKSLAFGVGDKSKCYCLQGNGIDRADNAGCNGRGWREDASYTLNTVDRPAVVYDARGNGDGDICPTVTGDHNNRVTDYTAVCCYAIGNGQADNTELHEKPGALNCMHDQQAILCCYPTKTRTLLARQDGSPCIDRGSEIVCYPEKYHFVLRRLTPTECARLQGMPDWWCDDVPHSDSAEYKMWGNGMALPCVLYVMEGIAEAMAEQWGNIT